MSGRIEAYVYASSEALYADATEVKATEAGPTVISAKLAEPLLFSSALSAWASALGGGYTLSWQAASQSVQIASGGPAFGLAMTPIARGILGFSADPVGAATSHTGDQQSLARFDGIRLSSIGLVPHEDVDLRAYRHGRYRAIAWSQLDVYEVQIWMRAALLDTFAASLCAAGRVRVWPDTGVSAAWSAAEPAGYLDAAVIALTEIEHRPSRGLSSARMILGRGR